MTKFVHNGFRGKIVRVVDGDTVDLDVDLGFHVHTKVRCRLVGVDTPERGHRDWEKATFAFANLMHENLDDDELFEELQKLASKNKDIVITVDENGDIEFEVDEELFIEVLKELWK